MNNPLVTKTNIHGSMTYYHKATLFPLEIRIFPLWDKYVVSNQPFASSPRSLNGTGYGTLKGKNLKENSAQSNWKRMRLPSLIVAAAWTSMPHNVKSIQKYY